MSGRTSSACHVPAATRRRIGDALTRVDSPLRQRSGAAAALVLGRPRDDHRTRRRAPPFRGHAAEGHQRQAHGREAREFRPRDPRLDRRRPLVRGSSRRAARAAGVPRQLRSRAASTPTRSLPAARVREACHRDERPVGHDLGTTSDRTLQFCLDDPRAALRARRGGGVVWTARGTSSGSSTIRL